MVEKKYTPQDRKISRRKVLGLLGVSGISAAVLRDAPVPSKKITGEVSKAQETPAEYFQESQESKIVNQPVQPFAAQDVPLFPDTPVVITPKHTTIQEENLKEGHEGWKVLRPDTANTGIFTAPNSVLPGESINFLIGSNFGKMDMNVFRLGWYGGKGGRLVHSKPDISTPPIKMTTDPKTKAPMANWDPAYTLQIPDDWRSGMYAAVVTGKNGSGSMTPFWVRSQENVSPMVTSMGLLTYDAYNNWNGLSLYGGATAVSLDRALKTRGGAGDVFPWDLALTRFMERQGFDTDYMVDVDSHDKENVYDGKKLVVLPGHHEYYTQQMKNRLKQAVDNGVNVALFGSNPVYWKVGLEDSVYGKNRIVVCYKNGGDPNKENPTGRFRDLGDPEAALFGVAYEQTCNGDDWVVSNPNHWVFEGTGFTEGSSIKKVVGPEFDTIFDGVPAGKAREILAASVVNKGPRQGHSYSVLVTHESGGEVFATGALNWVYSLDDYRLGWTDNYQIPVDEKAQIVAANVLKKLS